jgi:6-phosphogluconolactonase
MDRRGFLTGASALAFGLRIPAALAASDRCLLFVGMRSSNQSQNIYSSFFDLASGQGTPAIKAAEIREPTAFALSRNRKVLYATSEVGNDGKSSGALMAYAIDHRAGTLKLVNSISSDGGGPTSIVVDATGRNLIVADFGGGCTNVYRLKPGGELGERTASLVHTGSGPSPRQKAPHAHGVALSLDNRFLISPDLGADRMFISRFDAASGSLTPADPAFQQTPPGSGPRHAIFHPNGRFIYLLNEMGATVTTFSFDASSGRVTELQTIAVGAAGASAGEIAIRSDGRFLYTTTRTDSSIEVYAVDPAKGTLSLVQKLDAGGKTPWSMLFSPGERYVIVTNNDSSAVSIIRCDRESGKLQPTGTTIAVPTPAGAIFVPA